MRTTTPLPRKLLVFPVAGLAALSLAACGSHGSGTAAHTASASSTTAPSRSNGGGGATSTGGSGTTAASSSGGSSAGGTGSGGASVSTAPSSGGATSQYRDCAASGLSISLGEETGAAGTAGVPVVFRNDGRATCVLAGFPGVDGVVSGRSPLPATRASGGFEIARVVLSPGDSASALVTASDMPTGSATSCPAFAAFLVTPPNTTTTSRVTGALRDCSNLEVHPVVAGTSGS